MASGSEAEVGIAQVEQRLDARHVGGQRHRVQVKLLDGARDVGTGLALP